MDILQNLQKGFLAFFLHALRKNDSEVTLKAFATNANLFSVGTN